MRGGGTSTNVLPHGGSTEPIALGMDDPRAVLGAVTTTTRRRVAGLVALVLLLGLVALLSLALGARVIPPSTVARAVADALAGASPESYDATVIATERVPRTVVGLLVGLCLGGSGAIMQAITRNPLVDGGILGVELGAACAVVAGIVAFGLNGVVATFWLALAGAVATAVVVYGVSRLTRAASTAVSLVIAGAATAAMLGAVINLLIIRDESAFSRYRFWSIGQLAGRGDAIGELWPFAVAGLVLALLCGPTLNALMLGEAVAAGLGVRVRRAQLATALVAVLLCAAAVAAAGPIGFIGLVGAHLARLVVGGDQRLLLPFSMVAGATVLLAADAPGRLAPGHGEIAVGIMTAVVGTPFFVVLARTRRLVEA